MFALRKFCYHLVNRLADVNLIKNVTGFGLYDRESDRTVSGLWTVPSP